MQFSSGTSCISTWYIDVSRPRFSMPRPVEALPCGSRSMTRVRSPISARQAPVLIVVVVLPTPPFWLATAITRGSGRPGGRGASASIGDSLARPTGKCEDGRLGHARSAGRRAPVFHVKPPDPVRSLCHAACRHGSQGRLGGIVFHVKHMRTAGSPCCGVPRETFCDRTGTVQSPDDCRRTPTTVVRTGSRRSDLM